MVEFGTGTQRSFAEIRCRAFLADGGALVGVDAECAEIAWGAGPVPRPTSIENVADYGHAAPAFFSTKRDLVYRSLDDDAPPVLVGPRLEQVLRIEATSRVAVLDVEFRHCARLPETRGFVDKQAAVLWSRGDAPGAVPQGPSPAARNRSTVVSPACVAVEGAEAVVVDSCASVWNSIIGSGGPDQTSEFSSSITSKSIRLIFGRIDCSRRVLEARPKSLRQNCRI